MPSLSFSELFFLEMVFAVFPLDYEPCYRGIFESLFVDPPKYNYKISQPPKKRNRFLRGDFRYCRKFFKNRNHVFSRNRINVRRVVNVKQV